MNRYNSYIHQHIEFFITYNDRCKLTRFVVIFDGRNFSNTTMITNYK
ncbi:unnamed protein product [Schistosoma mattheei]|uniref:Uncharacterized protein n=1 Tax=Schistosoma mattheei TaxID=31246 RepID=A0A183NN97_9TREM|nr:unnamed protein product [Schistosoma mattheei]